MQAIQTIARILKCFAALSLCLNVSHNYFDGPTKLFSDLYPASLAGR
jgi:hypothetical protein